MTEFITLTFGDMAENHKGMEKIGEMAKEGDGFQYKDLKKIKKRLQGNADIYDVSYEDNKAYILVIKDGVNKLLGDMGTKEDLFREQKGLKYDKKAFMYGRVVDKHARWNLCFDEVNRDANYQEKKGTIVSFKDVPIMQSLMSRFREYFGEKAENLKVESNYYYDVSKCGIGFHGDSERRKVIGVRLGKASLPLYYQWFYKGKAVGEMKYVDLEDGDMYIMSEKAVGTDWKKKNVYTVRHATGSKKFISLK
jgi:hypothetical protein